MTDASEAGRALAASRPRAAYHCEVCGRPFEALARVKQAPRTCSSKCRQVLWRQAQKTRTPAP